MREHTESTREMLMSLTFNGVCSVACGAIGFSEEAAGWLAFCDVHQCGKSLVLTEKKIYIARNSNAKQTKRANNWQSRTENSTSLPMQLPMIWSEFKV
jgi:hypothetical protein